MRWTESVGLTLVNRDLNSLQLKTPSGQILSFCILQIFPFTSESKRMGIIVRVRTMELCQIQACDARFTRRRIFTSLTILFAPLFFFFLQEESTGEITFYMKGADVAMASIVQYNDWLEEEVKAFQCCCFLLGMTTRMISCQIRGFGQVDSTDI